MCYNILEIENAGMAELADAQDLGSCEAIRVGSTPTTRTRTTDCRAQSAVFFLWQRKAPWEIAPARPAA